MSLLLGMAFAALGLLALAAITASLRQSVPLVTDLRRALNQPSEIEELRLTMQDALVPEAEQASNEPRPLHQPKPITRLLQARKAVPEFA